jgi:carbamoyltransferase
MENLGIPWIMWSAGFEYDGRYGLNRAGRKLVREFGPRRRPGEGFSRHHKDVAASVQAKLEEVGMHLLHIAMDRIPSDNVCLSGGVALNVKMNGRLLRCGLVNDLFVLPAANDAGLSIGAAFELCRRLGRAISYAMDDAYLGPSYSESAIQEAIERHGLVHEYHKDIPAVVADLLVDGLLVGWFQGRMEFGPRALGNRSILADPRDPTMKDKINLRVKHREPFRPFCPSILEEAKDDYLDKAISSPFMTMAFQARPGARDRIPAVVHVDGSVRPQTVREEANPRFHQLISHFAKATGVSAVLNTSLNVRGEPICCTPEDALNCFLNTDMDAIALGSYLVRKSSNTHIVG